LVGRLDPAYPAGGSAFRSEGFLDQVAIARRGGGELALAALPPFLRALLVTDGTVTKILEAYFWEPVEVLTLGQDLVPADGPIPWIDVTAGDWVLQREARLLGARSGRVYASASSVIRTELIPETFRQRLIDREIGIGVLIRDSGLESYREVLEIGAEPRDARAMGDDGVFRTYRIIIGRAPVILITERFPLAPYR
jgi:chorismate-pyruvate lyase